MRWKANVPRTVCAATAGAILGMGALSACAADTQDQTQAVQRFFTALHDKNLSSACAMLAARTREDVGIADGRSCAESLPVDHLRQGAITGVQVWADRSRVDTATGSVFLAEFDQKWLITAVGCRLAQDAPAECVVSD